MQVQQPLALGVVDASSAIAEARPSSAVRLQRAASLTFMMPRGRTSASGNGERVLTTLSGRCLSLAGCPGADIGATFD